MRVVEGKTLRWLRKILACFANRQMFGVKAGVIMSARSPSQTTSIARRNRFSPPIAIDGLICLHHALPVKPDDVTGRLHGEMASASREQNSVADAVHQRILSINTVAERTSAGAQQRATDSSELADLAGELERLLGAYKYSK